MITEIVIEKAVGLKILPSRWNSFIPYTMFSKVSYKDFPGEGKIYYCCGESFPEAMVEVLFIDDLR